VGVDHSQVEAADRNLVEEVGLVGHNHLVDIVVVDYLRSLVGEQLAFDQVCLGQELVDSHRSWEEEVGKTCLYLFIFLKKREKVREK
jgi:hypothetical protein